MKIASKIFATFFVTLLWTFHVVAQPTIAQPYWSEAKVRFYPKANPIAGSPCYTLDLSGDANTVFGATQGINQVLLYNNKVFVSFDPGTGGGGVLVYNYSDIYPAKIASPVAVLNLALPVAGIAIQPSTGDLFIGTFNGGGIYKSLAAANYATATSYASNAEPSITTYVANLKFDAAGNLWFTEFDGNNNYSSNYLICYKNADKGNYFKIYNPPLYFYSTTQLVTGTAYSVHLLSQPEGIAFDASGNLYVANNNDDYNCNPPLVGTIAKISNTWIANNFLNQVANSTAGYSPTTADVTIYAPPSVSKPGGLLMDGNTLYINDQGQNQGSSYTTNGVVYKWDVTTPFNTTNLVASGIHTTYPGNGSMVLSTTCASSAKDILTYTIPSQVGSSVINASSATVAVTMPAGTNLTSLTPTFTVSANATANPLSGVAQNFSAAKTYVVTAQDGSTKTWTVTVTNQPTLSSAKDILTFTIPSQVGSSVINATNATVAVTMPAGTNLASLTPTFTVSANATANPLSGVAQNFSAAKTYVVTAQDGSTKTWTVTVTNQPTLSSAKDILTFTIPSQVGSSVINATSATVAVTMPAGTNLTSLTPTFTVSANATATPTSGIAQNFSVAKNYVVVAQDGSVKTWTVTVTNQSLPSTATFPNPCLIGYLHNWDDAGNGNPYIQLDNVNAKYNVINYAFANTNGNGSSANISLVLDPAVDANAATRTTTFISKMQTVQAQGRKVMISLGGAVSSGGLIQLNTIADRDVFISSVENILATYPFDGIDINMEGQCFIFGNQTTGTVTTPVSPTIDNFVYAIKQIMTYYRTLRGKKMFLTFAPERPHISGGRSSWQMLNMPEAAAYLPVITALKDSLEAVHVQLYGVQGDYGYDGSVYNAGTVDGALANLENVMYGYNLDFNGSVTGKGTYAGLPASKTVMAIAAPCSAASVGFLDTNQIKQVVNYLKGTITKPGSYTKQNASPVTLRGMMVWSINYDANTTCSKNQIATVYSGLFGPTLSSAKDILTFTIPSQVGSSVINATNATVAVTMPAGTNLTSLTPTFTVSANATANPLSGVAQNFSAAKTYVVTAQDGSAKTWTVTVTNQPTLSSAKDILTFTIPSQVGSSVINATNATVAVTMPAGTNLTSLTPTFTVSANATANPLSGVAQNFSAAKTYVVTAQDGSTKTWTVTVTNQPTLSSAKDILTFTIPSQVGSSVINATNATVAVTMPAGTNLTSLIPTFTVSANATANPLSGVAQNFSAAKTYVVTAQDGSTKTWTVTVTNQPTLSSAKDILTYTIPSQVGSSVISVTNATVAVTMPAGTNLTSLTPTFTVSANATANPLSGVAQNFSAAKTYVVTAQDGSTKTWTVTVTNQPTLSSAKDILTFTIPSQVGSSVINATNATVAVTMPAGTNLTSLTPTFTVSANATANPLSGVAQNFSAAKTYVVTAQDGSTKTWTVTVTNQPTLSSAKDILTFTIPSQVGSSVINATSATVAVTMPAGTNLTSLTPTFTVSANATANPLSGVAQNFSTAKTYVVTAQDGSTKTWTVTITLLIPNGIENMNLHTICLYPNPSNGIFHIDSEAMNYTQVKAFDQIGNEIEIVENAPSLFSLKNASVGIYWIHVSLANGQTTTLRLMHY